MPAKVGAVSDPVDVWVLRLTEDDHDRHGAASGGLLAEVLRNYGMGTPELDRRCRLCGHPDHGKPRLVGSADLDLSITHAGSTLVVAVGRSHTVGIDVETADRLRFDLRSAGGVFTTAESALIAREQHWRLSTVALWTRKEAVLKAIGWGLAYPLDEVRVAAPGTAVFDGTAFEVEVDGEAFGVATFLLASGEVLSVAAASPWPGVRWASSASALVTRPTGGRSAVVAAPRPGRLRHSESGSSP